MLDTVASISVIDGYNMRRYAREAPEQSRGNILFTEKQWHNCKILYLLYITGFVLNL